MLTQGVSFGQFAFELFTVAHSLLGHASEFAKMNGAGNDFVVIDNRSHGAKGRMGKAMVACAPQFPELRWWPKWTRGTISKG